jgi:two-component system cell cycle sensor histidine kinase PleC
VEPTECFLGYGQTLRVRQRADVRVLKAQIDLIVESAQHARLTAPLFALGIALVASRPLDFFGHRQIQVSAILPMVVTALGILAIHVGRLYQRDFSRPLTNLVEVWFPRFLVLQIATSATWGLITWVLWEPGNSLNHAFLAGCVCCVMAELVMGRASHPDFLVADIVPLLAISAARFLLDGTPLDVTIVVGLAAIAGYFFSAGRRLTHRLDEESRLRFEVEDLAQELEQARDEALRKRFEAETANASKTSFLTNMSHELRTPLNAILGFSEIIQRECFGPVGSPRYTEYASDIHSSGTHLLSLINDLLDVAKIEAGKMEIEPLALDVRSTFSSALRIIVARTRERRQQLVIQIRPDAPPLYADERAVKQILLNLVSNAVKFTPEGGRIVVAASCSKQGDFQIMVEDNGPGIAREKLERVFMPFNQVDNHYGRKGSGTGLGLTLVRGLAELHGGIAWIESDIGKGCRAYVVLPTQHPTAQTSATADVIA